MRRLLHLIFGWDYVSLLNNGICKISVNQDGDPYVITNNQPILLTTSNARTWRMFFIHGTIYDYFTEEEVEKIYGTTNRQ